MVSRHYQWGQKKRCSPHSESDPIQNQTPSSQRLFGRRSLDFTHESMWQTNKGQYLKVAFITWFIFLIRNSVRQCCEQCWCWGNVFDRLTWSIPVRSMISVIDPTVGYTKNTWSMACKGCDSRVKCSSGEWKGFLVALLRSTYFIAFVRLCCLNRI